jgi:hypothetical protein
MKSYGFYQEWLFSSHLSNHCEQLDSQTDEAVLEICDIGAQND